MLIILKPLNSFKSPAERFQIISNQFKFNFCQFLSHWVYLQIWWIIYAISILDQLFLALLPCKISSKVYLYTFRTQFTFNYFQEGLSSLKLMWRFRYGNLRQSPNHFHGTKMNANEKNNFSVDPCLMHWILLSGYNCNNNNVQSSWISNSSF
jgi:hypothetical protein